MSHSVKILWVTIFVEGCPISETFNCPTSVHFHVLMTKRCLVLCHSYGWATISTCRNTMLFFSLLTGLSYSSFFLTLDAKSHHY